MSNIWATRVANKPVMVEASGADWMQQHLEGAADASLTLEARLAGDAPVMQDDFWPARDSWLCYFRPYVVQQGTLYIPIKGFLAHDYGYALGDWLTGYTYIAKAFERGMDDPEVDRIAMVVSSGGGEVAGNFDLVDKIFSLRGIKPIQAFVNESAYSAAYSLASVADKISMTRTAGVGSVGVLTAHIDASEAHKRMGIKVTLIHAGEHKVDGNPYEALPADVKKRIQARIDSVYDIFVSTVARNRDMEESAVRGTEALTYSSAEAISIGFADEVLPFDDAVAAFSGALNDDPEYEPDDDSGDENMSFTQEQLDTARAEGVTQGKAEGATAERARIKAIITADAAVNRREVAQHLALNTSQTPEEALGLLAITPEKAEVPAAPAPGAPSASAFEQAMSQNNPNIQPGGEQANEQDESASTLAEFRAVNGLKKKD